MRFLIGNPLIMKEMAKHVPDAGAYAPVTILVDERADGVHLTYDKMTSLLAPYKNSNALKVAKNNRKRSNLLRAAAGVDITGVCTDRAAGLQVKPGMHDVRLPLTGRCADRQATVRFRGKVRRRRNLSNKSLR